MRGDDFVATHFLLRENLERRKQMADMGTKEAAEKWGYTQATISKWCRNGLIPSATQDSKGSAWHIPKNAKCPKKIKSNAKKRKEF